jgi:hypothetical protein
MTESQSPGGGVDIERYALDAMILARCRRPIGHEMTNAVQGLHAGLEILAKVVDPAVKAKVSAAECVVLLKRQLEGLQGRLKNILDDIAPPTMAPEVFDLAATVNDVVRFLTSDAAVASVRLETNIQTSVAVTARSSILRRLLVGFFLEAIDTMRGAGALSVKVYADGPRAVIELRDTRSRNSGAAQGGAPRSIDLDLLQKVTRALVLADGGECHFEHSVDSGLRTRIAFPAHAA